ncbi:glutaminyl-tRNA synthase (glutamine-hydrolyzing) subunit A [Candidatus Gottesmanbacteria bacterium RIFCSPLOWO2_01_FULL_49_10]|uniref:Glutamyl-tRNA(Gln) amidotransferase subunit A n=1 Tax=Candidatus Gottesmanbacteria bacterium RIFCSPLOWO2_01_FULL_49_10 TaxID=1798396 RepID=A0A1F6B0L3_9BACT|nr:MAG: glutaminyl-tRNA synthase (glutamine-hydrolyzing) subunit A [Candidatus Gottesmanbacteria bacterium RIFCSPLOWO2_01_FULL_49_10]
MDLSDLTIKEAREKLHKKEFSAAELVQASLERITAIDPQIHAFLTVAQKEATKAAQDADQLIAQGVNKPLLGIPVAAKDLYSTQNIRTTAGAKIIEHYIPPYDATAVCRLKEAGAIVIGKTNEDAWGHGSSGENSDYGPTKNPYDLTRVPGGSSSGSAAAVATGMCLAATGTDTGSSIRLPAAFCNLVGIKPTYGRVPRYGIIAMASSFDTIGHLTKTVYDNALVCEITSGKDPYDGTSADVPVPKYTSWLGRPIRGMKIGLPKEYFDANGMDGNIRRVIETATEVLKNLGAEIVDVSLPHTKYAMACYYVLVPSEISSNLARFDGIRYGYTRETFGQEAKRRIMIGTYALSAGYYDAYYLKAAKVRTLIKKDFDDAFSNVDVLIVPSFPSTPFAIGEKTTDPLSMYLSDIFMCPVNLAGVPAINMPAGFVDGLPVGMQIIGSQFAEEKLYKIAYAYEHETEWYKIKPNL